MRARRGETLTEALVGILIVGLSSAVLAAMIVSAARMNEAAAARDEALYAAVTEAENGTLSGGEGTEESIEVQVQVAGKTHIFAAKLCGDKDIPLCAYREAAP